MFILDQDCRLICRDGRSSLHSVYQIVIEAMSERRQNIHSDTILSDESKDAGQITYRLELEGQCKIVETQLLAFSYIKTSLLLIPFMLSIVGLFLLKYYKTLRAKVFYWPAEPSEATHIYIKGNGKKEEEIVPLHSEEGLFYYFFYKKLKYQFLRGQVIPIGLNYQKELVSKLGTNFLKTGLEDEEVAQRMAIFGNNTHIVDPPQYYEYLYEVMTEPFFFIQYMAAVIYIVQKLTELSILLLGSSVITTSINYILLYISYRKIKEIAEKVVEVEVIRNGRSVNIPSSQLVPGDIFIPRDELYCDVILLKGELYVNESNLTGESIPIAKVAIEHYTQWSRHDSSKWIFQGSKILSSSTDALAMVVHTGYSSKRGRILRKILHRTTSVPHFFTTCIYFLAETYVISILIYLGTLPMRISNDNMEPMIIFLNFLLLITFCFSPSFPIYFNLVYSFCLMRLKWKNILGTQPQKTIEAAHLQTMCFDKTGTLTEDKVEVTKVLKLEPRGYQDITLNRNQEKGLDFKVFGSCHTVRFFNKELLGDEIDLKMFGHSGYSLIESKQSGVCFEVETAHNLVYNKIRILKIFQYESKFQSMSVMVYDFDTNKYYVFVKGAPEIIHSNSKIQYQYFDDLLQEVSYGGFRSIAYGYKQIPQELVNEYLHETRENYMKNIYILGLLVLENRLKEDAEDTIKLLAQAGIESRIITGDNIYIAIETAIRCGILNRTQQIMVIEGKDQCLFTNAPQHEIYYDTKIFTFQEKKVCIAKQRISYEDYIHSPRPIVIDNDFLKLRDDLDISGKIRVYARISPENKAKIVRSIKENIRKKRGKLTKMQKLMSDQVNKVGMCGDGANDLLAIKEADIGVGIRNCDSSYAASFSILNLKDIDEIIREAKCGEKQIIEICRFVSIGGFLSVPLLVIMETQAAFFSSFQLIFGNLSKYLLINILLALSKPAPKPTIYKPCSNFLKIQNQLTYWGNAVIGSMAHVAVMLYFRTTEQYTYNTTRATLDSGWVALTPLVTSQYLYFSISPIFLSFALHQGSPFKEPINKNILLSGCLILNLIFSTAMFFLVPHIKDFLNFVDISYTSLAYIFMICSIANILTLIYNGWIQCLKLHERQAQLCIPEKQEVGIQQLPDRPSSSSNQR